MCENRVKSAHHLPEKIEGCITGQIDGVIRFPAETNHLREISPETKFYHHDDDITSPAQRRRSGTNLEGEGNEFGDAGGTARALAAGQL